MSRLPSLGEVLGLHRAGETQRSQPMTRPIVERLRHDAEQMIAQDAFYWARATNEAADTIEELVEKADLLVETLYLHDLPPKTLNALTELEIVLAKIGGDA
jgi:hypothetical protein